VFEANATTDMLCGGVFHPRLQEACADTVVKPGQIRVEVVVAAGDAEAAVKVRAWVLCDDGGGEQRKSQGEPAHE
jgi:hypothetical protein